LYDFCPAVGFGLWTEVIVRKRAGVLFAVAGLLPGVLGLSSTAAQASDQSVHTFLTGTVAFSPSDAWTVG
jgi:hypothetical protein